MTYDDRAEGWIPHIPTLSAWRAGRIRIYMPDAFTVVTMPGHAVWPVMTSAETRSIRAITKGPWIPDGTSYEGVPHDRIDEIDAQVAAGEDPVRSRPMLVWDETPIDLAFVSPPPPPSAVLPPHIIRLIVSNAVSQGAVCPINLTPLAHDNAAVTPCGHVFDSTALKTWRASGHDSCPECRCPLTGPSATTTTTTTPTLS